jgi:VanZ family protein
MTLSPGARDRLLRWLPAVAWMVVIFVLSSRSGLRLTEDAAVDKPFRIVAHLATFALLGGLLLHAIGGRGRPTLRAALGAVALTLLYAISDELHQAFVPGRTGRVQDVGTDLVGAVIGVAIAAAVLTYLQERRSADQR